MVHYPGRPPHALPFHVEARGPRAIAHLASGDTLDLTELIPLLARQARRARYPRKSCAAGLRALRRTGVRIDGGEWEALITSSLRLVAELEEEDRRYVDEREAARILGVPVSTIHGLLDSEDGRRALGHPVVIGETIRIPRAVLDPCTRVDYLDRSVK
jgi:hypothetical protein